MGVVDSQAGARPPREGTDALERQREGSSRLREKPSAPISYPTLEHVAMEARPYPTHLLEGCETGLVLFAAAFLGHNDAIHMAESGMRVTCVDTDKERLQEMAPLYPADWLWVIDDAWEFANRATGEVMCDAVSADTFTGEAMERSLANLDLWCSLARKLVTVTLTAGTSYTTPVGWMDSLYERASGVYWLVLTRD